MPSEAKSGGRWTVPVTALLCFGLDFLSKTWARSNLIEGQSQPFMPGLMRLSRVGNSGAAFSLGSGNGMLMAALATAMTLVLVCWAVRRELIQPPPTFIDRAGVGCLIGGALGNLLDRFLRGRVTDFLEFTFMPFPVFNVADVLIDVGIGLLIIAALGRQEKKAIGEPVTTGSQSSD